MTKAEIAPKNGAIARPVAVFQAPTDKELLASVGAVAVAHGHLEYILRMTVRTLAGLSIIEALDATQFQPMVEIRKQIKKLFAELSKDNALRLKLDALMEKARKESEQRNELLHRPWAVDSNDQWLTKDEYHQWGPLPGNEKFKELEQRIYSLVHELNDARLAGFIAEVAKLRNKDQSQ